MAFQGYQETDIAAMHERARQGLPKKGVPEEVLAIIETKHAERHPILQGKGAVPGHAAVDPLADPLENAEVSSVMPDVEGGTHADESEKLRRVLVDLASPVPQASPDTQAMHTFDCSFCTTGE